MTAKARPRRLWSRADLQLLREIYPDRPTDEVAQLLRREIGRVHATANRLGIRKSPAFFEDAKRAGRFQKLSTAGSVYRYPKGHVPANKGLRRPGFAPGRMAETQFKKGRLASEARNYVPIGTLKLCKDCYLTRKVTDDPALFPARRWVAVHRLVWIEANGPIPPGHAVGFKPGQRTNVLDEITLDRLELVSRVDLMRRNSFHTNFPKEIGQLIQLRGAVMRKINNRERNEKQDQ